MNTVLPAWASLPVYGPARLGDWSLNRHQAEVLLGTPPQNTSFVIDTGASPLLALTRQCLFCPSAGVYDPHYSSSAKLASENYVNINMSGTYGSEAIALGGILQDGDAPIAFINNMSPEFAVRFSGGHLGLFVPPVSNASRRAKSILHRLDEQGQLLNPVWGLRLSGENPRLTIGALDPNEYQGEINWVPLVLDHEGLPIIQVDSLRGYQGNVFPLQYPITAWIDSFASSIKIPDLAMYMMNESLLGPHENVNINSPGNQSFGVLCNDSITPNNVVELSVEINGVIYPINQLDLVRPASPAAALGFCNVGVTKSVDSTFGLGLTFLRSVYFAFRFPSDTCPGYWGFATPKGSPVPSPTQRPRSTPVDADTCLSFVMPSSTPTPTITSYTGLLGSDGKRYQVYGRPNDQLVELRGAEEFKGRKVTGGTSREGG